MSAALQDQDARHAIATDLTRTLFVEAGAGSGKTGSLVGRVVSTVLEDGVPLHQVAAVTFTEKAAAELRDRLRARFERAVHEAPDEVRRARATAALDDLDAAAIGTLHSFAQRVLGEHPVEAGLPPLIEVSDEVSSQVAFEHRWTALRAAMLEEQLVRAPLLLALAAGVRLDHLRSIARTFNGEWDRLDSTVLAGGAPGDPDFDLSAIGHVVTVAADFRQHCAAADDRLLAHLHAVQAWHVLLLAAPDDPARLQVLADAAGLKSGHGRRANFTGCDIEDARNSIKAVKDTAARVHREVLDKVLRRLARRIAEATLDAARERQQQGSLEFHDLLVLARGLLRDVVHGLEVRTALSERYTRLLLDEFQDTDPMQIEIAVRIAGGAAAAAEDWRDVDVPPGRLFVVGDPKQSIYRFRRADIATYLEAQERVGEPLSLTTNFRTTAGVLAWVNHVFGRLIIAAPGSQPAYEPLAPDRDDAPGGTRILVLGEDAHPDTWRADDVREAEAEDVAGVIRTALEEEWQVFDDRTKQWRTVELDDIAVLVPARTSLPQLEESLDAAKIPFRAEASSLVYRTPEVRDLLMTARAVDDPSDALTLVAALRSPLYGCGDDDLWTWKQAGGAFHLYVPTPDAVPQDHPVRLAMDHLSRLGRSSRWLAPNELLDRIVRDRRMLETGALGPRARDVWRRLRFVVDQARAWSEAQAGGLRDYLDWAHRQGDESARVAEAVLPETDARSVRVLTIHSAKGLEFPVVIVSGMSSMPGGNRGGVEVLWPRTGGYQLALNKDLQTDDFEVAKPIDEQMGHHERLRLLYVACTRARDHLVVSTHRAARRNPVADETRMTSAELLADGAAGAPVAVAYVPPPDQQAPDVHRDPVPPAPSYEAWRAGAEAAQAAGRRAWTISASSLEGTLQTEQVDPGLAKAARDLELPPWNKGRYGTAIGRAVHGVLQTVDLATEAGLAEAVAAQSLAEGVVAHQDVFFDLCRAALTSPVVSRAARSRHWRETYVGTTLPDKTVLEGYIDLVYEADDGCLVVVDYKTDAVPGAALPSRVQIYLPQMAAYARALEQATGRQVSRAVLLFLSPAAATEVPLDRLTLAAVDVGLELATRTV